MIRSSLIAIFILFALWAEPAASVEIYNFKSGLICHENFDTDEHEATVSSICFETDTIYITGQGSCIYDGERRHCTWYGFEFDYRNVDENDVIMCRSNYALPNDEGGPDGVRHEDTTFLEWPLELPPGDGHYYHPQYSIAQSSFEQQIVDSTETVCSVGNEELFRFRFVKVFPHVNDDAVLRSLERNPPREKWQ